MINNIRKHKHNNKSNLIIIMIRMLITVNSNKFCIAKIKSITNNIVNNVQDMNNIRTTTLIQNIIATTIEKYSN
jgi:hypothetical protein